MRAIFEMKIPISDKNKPLLPPHKLYLIACASVMYGFDVAKGLTARWILPRHLMSKIFMPGNIVLVMFPLLVLGLSWSTWKLYDVQRAEHAAAEVFQLLSSYEFLDKPLPSEFFSDVDLFCNAEGGVIDLSDKDQVLSSKFTLTNNSDYPIVFRPGGKHTIHVRPRLWNSQMTSVVKDGIKIHLDIGNVVAVNSKSTVSGILTIKNSDLDNVPDTSRYLAVGVVQEFVEWTSSNNCKFEVEDERA